MSRSLGHHKCRQTLRPRGRWTITPCSASDLGRYLIFKSGYFPRILGVLLGCAGVSSLVNSFALLLAPSLASALFPAILLPALVGELAFCLWLLVKGVDANAWKRQVSTTNSGAMNGH